MIDFGTGDLETDPFKKGRLPEAFASGFYDGKTVSVFWGSDCIQKFITLCLKVGGAKDGKYIVFLHNGGKFDMHFFLRELLEKFDADLLEITAIGSRIVKIKTPLCEFRDSYAIIPKPLKSFGNKKEIEIEKLEREVREENKDEICSYLRQDCVGLYDGLKSFFELYGTNLTLASTAFSVSKKQFGMKPINTKEKYDEKFRPYYFAGRVQFFPGTLGKNGELDGKKRYSILDINSAFPWAMLSNHWFGKSYDFGTTIPKVNAEQSFYEIICDSKGALPVRSKQGVDFPIIERGSFFATGWELLAGLELGLITKLKILGCYTPTVLENFAPYVNHFYDLKKNAPNAYERDFAKLFLNSLYGKYAINPRSFRDVTVTKWGEIPEPKKVRLKNKRFKKVDWELSFDDLRRGLSFWQSPSYDPEGEKQMRFYNVCTAASITGCVRAFLQRSMSSCKSVLYCDTDSIIAKDVSALVTGEELGQWKLEKECDCVFIGGKKLYCAHGYKPEKKQWKTASKGVRLSVEDLISVCEGEAKSCSFDAPNYSVFSSPRFTTRTVRRDDKRKKK